MCYEGALIEVWVYNGCHTTSYSLNLMYWIWW
jgi:hypothetical protein